MSTRGGARLTAGLIGAMVVGLALAPAFTLRGVALGAPAPITQVTTPPQATNFGASGINIWSHTTSAVDWTIAHANWNTGNQTTDQTTSFTGISGRSNVDLGGCAANLFDCFSNRSKYYSFATSQEKIGFDATVSTSGQIDFKGRADDLAATGTVAVGYPGTATFSYPQADSFVRSDTIQLGGTWTRGTPTMSAGTTTADIEFIGNFGLGASASANVYLGSGSADSGGGTIIPAFNASTGDLPLFSMGVAEGVPVLVGELFGLTPIGEVVSGSLNIFSVQPTTLTANPDGSLTLSGENNFSNVTFDLDAFASNFTGKRLPPLSKTERLGPLSTGYSLLDANAPVQLYAKQDLRFQHDGARIRLSFSQPVAEIGGSFLAKDPGNGWVEIRPGQNPTVRTGTDAPITVTPSTSLDNPRVTNFTQLRTTGAIEMSSGAFEFSMDNAADPPLPLRVTVFPAIPAFDTGLDWPEEIKVDVGFVCDLKVLGECVAGHPTFRVDVVLHDIVFPGTPGLSFDPPDFSFGPIWPVRVSSGCTRSGDKCTYLGSTTPNTIANNVSQNVNIPAITLNTFVLVPRDTTPPLSSVTATPGPNARGWNNTDVTVTIVATDSRSGVASTTVRLDGSAVGTTFTIGAEGIHTVVFFSTDNVGNTEAPKTMLVGIDKTAPEGGVRFAPDTQTLEVFGGDTGSGVRAVTLVSTVAAPKNAQIGGDWAQRRSYTIMDNAGNVTTLLLDSSAAGKEIKAALASIQYDAGPTVAFRDRLSFEWSLDKPAGLKELEQSIEVRREPGRDDEDDDDDDGDGLRVEAKFEAKKGTTTIRTEGPGPEGKVVRTGLVLLELVTDRGELRIKP